MCGITQFAVSFRQKALMSGRRKDYEEKNTEIYGLRGCHGADPVRYGMWGGSDDASDVNAASETETAEEAEKEAVEEAEAEAKEAAEDVEAEAKAEVENGTEAAAGQTLEDYFSDPDAKEAFEAALDAMAGEELGIEYDVTGNDFTMEFTFNAETELPDNAGEMLAAEIDNQADTFGEQVETFDQMVGQTGACTVTVRYFAADGTLLAEKTFSAK